MVYMKRPMRHIRILWRIKRLARYFSKLSSWDETNVVFVIDVSEVTLTSTFLVEDTFWDLQDTHIVSEGEVATSLLGLRPTSVAIQEDTSEIDQHKLSLDMLAPLNMVALLLKLHFISLQNFMTFYRAGMSGKPATHSGYPATTSLAYRRS